MYSSLFVVLVWGIYGPFLLYNQHQSLVIRDWDTSSVALNRGSSQVQAGFIGAIIQAEGNYEITDAQNQNIIGSSLYAGDKITLNDGAVFNFSLAKQGNASIQWPAVFILHKQTAQNKDQKDTYTIQLLEGTYAHVSSKNDESLIALESPELTVSQNSSVLDIQFSSLGSRSVLTNKGGRVTVMNTSSKIAKTLEWNQIAHVSTQDFEIIKTPEQAKTLAKVLQDKSFTKTYEGDEEYNKKILAVVDQFAQETMNASSQSQSQENSDENIVDHSSLVALTAPQKTLQENDSMMASTMFESSVDASHTESSPDLAMWARIADELPESQKVPSKEQVLALEKQLYPDFVMKQVKDMVSAHLKWEQNAYSIAATNIAGLLNNLSSAFELDTKVPVPLGSLSTLSVKIDEISFELQKKYYIPSRSLNNLSALKNRVDALSQQQFGSVNSETFPTKNLYERLNIQSSSLYLIR